jgi:hypothetical protein
MSVIGWLTVIVGVGFVILAIQGIWVLIDAFLIPGMVQADKAKLRQSLTPDAILSAGAARQDRQNGTLGNLKATAGTSWRAGHARWQLSIIVV